jgi:3',5'-cyclic-AMP phosphodiesterase
MSDVLGRQLNRRQFLTVGLAAAAGGVLTLQPQQTEVLHAGVPVDTRRNSTRWAFLSDTHIHASSRHRFRGFYPYQNLQKVVDQIGADLPDGLVITGDLARSRGSIDAYDNVKALLEPIARERPIHMGLGNHDRREDFLHAFAHPGGNDSGLQDRHIITAMAGPIRMIVLDTLLYVNLFPGRIGKLQRTWLENYLWMTDETPTILFLHHSPRADLLDSRRLFDIISPVRKVKAVVFGHSHKYRFTERDGIHLINLPATGYNFTGGQPVGWVEARLTAEGGEFVLHAVGGNMSRHGSVRYLHWRA